MWKEIKKFIFRRRLWNFIKKMKVGTIEDAEYIVVTRTTEYDVENNFYWNLDVNKSFPRDLVCNTCKHQVVMSNGTFMNYQKAPTPEKILCASCLLIKLQNEKS